MLAQIAKLLIETVAGLLVIALLARFHFQWLRVPLRNPLGAFVIAVTDWLVLPARRLVPPLRGFDLASLAGAWLVQFAALWMVHAVFGFDFTRAPGAALAALGALALLDLLIYSLYLLIAAVIVQAVLSWVNPYTPLGPVFDAFARPFLRPIRRVLPPIANIDLSPLALIVIVQVLLIPVGYARGLVAAMP